MPSSGKFKEFFTLYWKPLTSILAVFVTIAGGVWKVFDEIKYKPLVDRFIQEEKKLKDQQKEIVELREKLGETINKTDLYNVVKLIGDNVTTSFNKENTLDGHGLRLSANSELADEYIDTTFKIYLEDKVFYPAGKYTLREAYDKSKIINAIATFATTLKSVYSDGGLDVIARFEGGADTICNSCYIGKYQGEFGTIILNDVYVDGKMENLFLQKGDLITDADLAVLRSYGVYDAFLALARPVSPILEFNFLEFKANTFGGNYNDSSYRFGKITIGVKSRSGNNTKSSIQSQGRIGANRGLKDGEL